MKNLLFLFLVSIFLYSCGTKSKPKTIYIVRHAEKQLTQDRDPELAQVGMFRSIKLSQILADKDIKHIYSTNYKRTRHTAQPTSDDTQLPIQIYDPAKQEEFAELLKGLEGNILVVGHSNTAPRLVNILLGEEGKYPDLEDVDYENIYIVSMDEGGSTSEVKTFKDFSEQ